jgi:outer membrane receptor protein involved in Fe transport
MRPVDDLPLPVPPRRGRPGRPLGALLLVLALFANAPGIFGQEEPLPPPEVVLPPMVVEAPPALSSSSEILIPGKSFELRPQGRPGDILRLIPGFVIAQHHGGGKAEQYFLRGFDGDHGTDIAFFADGLPVNLRSHAHGQGYTDLHFIIPETLARVDVFKGPYYAEFGDFATAAAINFVTLDVVDENLVQAGGGSFNTQRYLTLFSPTRGAFKTLFAGELYYTDGPFDRPQHYRRANVFAKATAALGEDMTLRLIGSYLYSDWFGSGEIPLRAVHEGLIDRFGSIDNSQGGVTQRLNLNGNYLWKPTEDQVISLQGYASYYFLNMYSNFTFFLVDQEDGDGIQQYDRRWYGGFDGRYERQDRPFGVNTTSTAGFQYRNDSPTVVLGTQADRHRLERNQNVNIREQSYSPYVKVALAPAALPWLRFNTGARGDIFSYNVQGVLEDGTLNGSEVRAIPSVKANLALGPWYTTEFFANFGTGFHSNDARAVILDPSLDALARAQGYEFGVRVRPHPRVQASATYWALNLNSELVFVGDEGTTEASAPSRREGVEFSTQVQLLDWLAFNGNFTYTKATFDNGDAVPLAPRWTALADLTARWPWGLSVDLAVLYLGPRYLTEDRSVIAKGYTLTTLTARYRYKAIEAFVSLNNALNQNYSEGQLYYTSRLRGEPAEGVTDVHFTPGAPISVFGGLALRF